MSCKKLLYFVLFLQLSDCSAQVSDFMQLSNNNLEKLIISLKNDRQLPNDKLLSTLGRFSQYSSLTKIGKDSIYYINDPAYGKIPFKLFIPASYDPSKPNALIVLLHGAVTLGTFEDGFRRNNQSQVDGDPFINAFRSKGYIILMPYADPAKKFNWVSADFTSRANATFNALINLIKQVKRVLNIDDDRVFSYGHSDGSDGTFALDIYKSFEFAGFVAYNSMLTNLFANNIYLRNAVNRPLYLVHSDLDNLRPIQQTRLIVHILDSLKAPVTYKEYIGYKHFDRHLAKDFNNSIKFLDRTIRNPFLNSLYWETNDTSNRRMDWINITGWDIQRPAASWHTEINVDSYDKNTNTWVKWPYFTDLDKSTAIRAVYNSNHFTIETSRVTQFEIMLSPQMVDLDRNIEIVVNGKLVFNNKVSASNNFTIDNFLANYDRKALWVNSIRIDVPK